MATETNLFGFCAMLLLTIQQLIASSSRFVSVCRMESPRARAGAISEIAIQSEQTANNCCVLKYLKS